MVALQGFVVWFAWPLVAGLVLLVQVRSRRGLWHALGVLALATYALWIASVAFFPIYIGRYPGLEDQSVGAWDLVNLVPLRSLIRSFAVDPGGDWWLRVYGGNILLLVPFTLVGPVLWSRMRKWWKALLMGLGMSVGIELVQLALRLVAEPPYRSVDIDDVILNTSGALLGYGLFAAGRWYAARHRGRVSSE